MKLITPLLKEPAMRPVIIGRAQQGPALSPTKVSSFEEFVQVFGHLFLVKKAAMLHVMEISWTNLWRICSVGQLRNNSPVTYVRLVGIQNDDATADGEAGWDTENQDQHRYQLYSSRSVCFLILLLLLTLVISGCLVSILARLPLWNSCFRFNRWFASR